MSDNLVTRPRSGSPTPPPRPQTPTPTETPPVPEKVTKSGRVLNAFGRGAASTKRSGRSAIRTISETTSNVGDFIAGELHETDYLRRAQRFQELIDDNKDDERYSVAIAEALKSQRFIQNYIKKGTSDWTGVANSYTLYTEALLDGLKQARKIEAKARNDNPKIAEMLDRTSKALDTAKVRLPPEEHKEFTKQLNGLQLNLAQLPDKKQDKDGKLATALGVKANTLAEQIASRVTALANKQNLMQLELTRLRTRLAGAPEGEPGSDPRLGASQLLIVADNAIFAFDFTAAETALESATVALNTMNAPTTIEPATEILKSVNEQLRRAQALQDGADSLPEPVGPELVKRVLETIGRLEGISYALTKGGDAVGPDASRTVEECKTAFNDVKSAIDGFAEFQTQKTTLDQEFTKLRQRVQFQAQAYYQKMGIAGAGDGAFQTRVADVAGQWQKALGTSVSIDELDQEAYLNQLNAITSEMAQTKANPDDVAVEKAISRYRKALAALKQAAAVVIAADSDKAISMGLVTQPAALEKEGTPLVVDGGIDMPQPGRVTKLDELTDKLVELTERAAEFNPTSVAFEVGEQRRQCEDMIRDYKNRIKIVLDDVDTERKKLVSIGTNQTNRDALTKYGATILSDLDTIGAPLVSSDAGLLGDVRDELATFRKRIVDFEALGPNGKNPNKIPNFETLKKKVDELTKKLTDDSRFKARAEMTKPWLDELKKLDEDLTGTDPTEVSKTLARITGLMESAKKTAKTESKAATESALRLKNLAADVVLAKGPYAALTSESPAYAADLDKRLLKLADQITAADKPDDKAANALIVEVQKAIASAPAGTIARGTGEKTAKEEQKKRDDAKSALTKLKEVDIELLEEKAGKLKGDARKELFKQIKDLRDATDSALKALEITGDAAAANAMVEAIANRIKRAAAAPLGSSTRARNNLTEVEKRWVVAVETLIRSIQGVPGLVTQQCGDDEAAKRAAAALQKQLVDPVAAIFRRDAFAAIIKRIQSADDKGALSAREDALREVRRLRKLMTSDSRVHMISGIPFPGAAMPFPEIGAALWDLETNLMTSG
jgi:hypothetical protein